MTIELDSTLAQAEVLFLSFAQLVADIDRRQAEQVSSKADSGLRNRKQSNATNDTLNLPILSDNLRDLLRTGRH